MIVTFTTPFLRQLKKLHPNLQEEAVEKVELFEQNPKHPSLKMHKLKGRLKDRWSFSVNYKTRIVFMYLTRDEVVLLAVGNHDVYNT
jgi:addiction module RelE/StbE family toxin